MFDMIKTFNIFQIKDEKLQFMNLLLEMFTDKNIAEHHSVHIEDYSRSKRQ